MYNPGDLIDGRYRVFARKKGGMGFVFLCEDMEWKVRDKPVKVAVKTLLPELLEIPGASERFYNEALLWVELGKHVNIVQAQYVKRIKGFPFIFMEYVTGHEDFGPDLSGWIQLGALDLTRSLHFAIQICNGMIYANERFSQKGLNFVHRDLKPKNALITASGLVKLTDFGLSKVARGQGREKAIPGRKTVFSSNMDLTLAGTLMGSPKYMSPEQCESLSDLDIRSDIYSFGCMFYEMLTRRPPFKADNLQQMVQKHLRDVPSEPTQIDPDLPTAVDTVTLRCLQKRAPDRYPDFTTLRDDLTALFETVTGMPHPSTLTDKPASVQQAISEKLNKSLSLYELGKRKEGVRLFAEAMGLKREGKPSSGQGASPRRLVKAGLKKRRAETTPPTGKPKVTKESEVAEDWEDAETFMQGDVPVEQADNRPKVTAARKARRPKRKPDGKE